MKVIKIGSEVKCTSVKFSGRSNKYFLQSFKVLGVGKMQSLRTPNIVAVACHKIGVFW